MNKKTTILETKSHFAKKFKLDEILLEYETYRGTTELHEREVFSRKSGFHFKSASAVLYDISRRTIVLVEQFRLPTYLNGNENGLLLEVCAGAVEPNEDTFETIFREITEETGYLVPRQNIRLAYSGFTSPGVLTEKMDFFIAEYDETMKHTSGGGLHDEQEDVRVVEMLFDEAWEMVLGSKISDTKTILLLQHLKIHIFS